jgi:hypothetical protein
MWTSDQFEIVLAEIEAGDPPVVLVRISTPAGNVDLLGAAWFEERTLYMKDVHIGGLEPGARGLSGLNAIGRRFLEVAGVKQIIIQGGVRTTGRNPGRPPTPFRFPKYQAPATAAHDPSAG